MDPVSAALVKQGASLLARKLAAMLGADRARVDELRREIWEEIGAANLAALAGAGCVRADQGRIQGRTGGLPADVAEGFFATNPLGEALLAFVETWQEGDPLPGDV